VGLKFNTLLGECEIDPKDVQLVRHKDSGPTGITPFSLLRDNPAQFEAYQGLQGRQVFHRSIIASFVVTPSAETLFVNLYRISGAARNISSVTCPVNMTQFEAGKMWIYELAIDKRLNDFSQRLIIDWGEGYRSWVQRAVRKNKEIVEIRRHFEEPKFPQYLAFRGNIEDIPSLYPTWRSALAAAKGIYLLVCNKTGAQYVGSATGEKGFFGRWFAYSVDGHGGNVLLRARDHKDYTVSILEISGSAADRREILARETFWKEKLGSRALRLGDEYGLNAN